MHEKKATHTEYHDTIRSGRLIVPRLTVLTTWCHVLYHYQEVAVTEFDLTCGQVFFTRDDERNLEPLAGLPVGRVEPEAHDVAVGLDEGSSSECLPTPAPSG